MSRKRTTGVRSERRAASSKTDFLRFWACGELILAPNTTFPIELTAASLDGSPAVLVEMIAKTFFGEFGLRRGLAGSQVKLDVCGRQFCARIANQMKNSPILWLEAADVFAGLFPRVAS
jgi:hypothetical protein